MKFTRLLFIFSLIFFCSSLCSVLAEAPQTPKIVFPLIDSGNSEIYLMNPDGTEQVRLTHNKAFDVSPMWSPKGEQILFTSNRDGVNDLYLMDSDGKNVKRVWGADANLQSWIGWRGTRAAYGSTVLAFYRRLVRSGVCTACFTTTAIANNAVGAAEKAVIFYEYIQAYRRNLDN